MGKRDPIPPKPKLIECHFEQRKGGDCYCRTCQQRIKGKQAKKHRAQRTKIVLAAGRPLANGTTLYLKPAPPIRPAVKAVRSGWSDKVAYTCNHDGCRMTNWLYEADARALDGKDRAQVDCQYCCRPITIEFS